MIRNVDIKGLWWLPENPEYKVAGMLHHEPMGKTKLDLIGEFRPNDWLHSFKYKVCRCQFLGATS